MQGKRIEDNKHCANPGEYSKCTDTRPYGKVFWNCTTPNGLYGCLANHNVTEHEDGTITVSPSILVGGEGGWHGYLERGVWREC